MSDFLKCECPHCGQHLEYNSEGAGQVIDCPLCKQSLNLPSQNLPQPTPITLSAPESPYLLPVLTDESLRSIKVRSSDGIQNYTVNLLDYTCICPSFVEDHSKALPREVGRLCKHICNSLNRADILPLLNPICLAMVQEGWGIYPGRFGHDNNGNPIYITGVNTTGWLNVFALKRKDGKNYFRFGYSVNEGRWAYGYKPKVNEEILYPNQSRRHLQVSRGGQGLHIFWTVFGGIARFILFVAKAFAWIFLVVLAALLKSGTRRRRKF